MDVQATSKMLKALADPARLQIIHSISTGEKCACDILADFDFTQPTLSHHLKILSNAGFISTRKEGTWHFYSLNEEKSELCQQLIQQLFHQDSDTIANRTPYEEPILYYI